MTKTESKSPHKAMKLFGTLIISIVLCAMSPFALANGIDDDPQEVVSVASETGMVTISSRGLDIRDVLFDLFDQTDKNFVLSPNVRHVLYLSLAGVKFDEALFIVCTTAGLDYQVSNDIFYIGFKNIPVRVSQPQTSTEQPRPIPQPTGRYTDPELEAVRLTTRLSKTDIREVFAEFAKQTNIKIEVDPEVPNYKLDAFLIDTSLLYSLQVVTKAAGLEWVKTDRKSILIRVPKKN